MRNFARTAKDIYQSLLDDIGDAITRDDFEAYQAHFRLPHQVQTFTDRINIAERADLAKLFEGLRQHIADNDAKELIRHCSIAEFIDPETIRGSHDSFIVSQRNQLIERYTVLSTLRLIEERWQVCDSQYAANDINIVDELTQQLKGSAQYSRSKVVG